MNIISSTKNRFDRLYIPEPNSGCWLWLGSIDSRGYGKFYVEKRNRPENAHRASWMLHRGPIPGGKSVCHECDNPTCVNPDHLWIGSHADNMRDRDAKGRRGYTGLRGERNHRAKLTKKEAEFIRSDSRPAKELAAEYGMHWSTIYRIKSGRYWS